MARRPVGRDEQRKAWAQAGSRKDAPAKPAKGEGATAGPQADLKAVQPGAKRPKPSPEAMARAKAMLAPPPAPWHPLPLAELAIVIGFIAILIAAVLADRDGVLAGFLLIVAGTAEFSWREHRHGFRPHATVLAMMLGLAVGVLAWRVVGLSRNASLGAGAVVFLLAWGAFDKAYVPAHRRAEPAPPHG